MDSAARPQVASSNAASFDPAADDVFQRIAEKYDFLCDVFSLYAHRLWKSRMARRIADVPGRKLIDVATGTGDIPYREIRLQKKRGNQCIERHYVISDLSPAMLAMAERKLGGVDAAVDYCVLDAHDLHAIDSASVDIYSISFAMKILDRSKVLAEAHRILKPGGRFFCLEAARIPVAVVHAAYLRYMNGCLPIIARLATGGDASAYQYLLRGIHTHPNQRTFARELAQQGFSAVSFENLTFGIVAIHSAVKVADHDG